MAKSIQDSRVIFILPAYNEEAAIRPVVRNLHELSTKMGWRHVILVCDDGSRDGTGEALAELQAEVPTLEVIPHKINRGLGETARDLFERAAEIADPDDAIIRMDCDETHGSHYTTRLLIELSHGYDVVIASRFAPGGGQKGLNAHRMLLTQCARYFMGFFFPIPGVRDYSCGYRAYRARIVQKAIAVYGNSFIQLKGLGFTGTLEKLVKLHLIGARIGEAPFTLRYDHRQTQSKMVSSVTTLGYMVMVILYYWPFGGWRWRKWG
ncbi:MAG: glycosyltransferase [Magnetospirillum sp. WYHS-4]